MTVPDLLAQTPIVAIIRLPDLTHAVELARALLDGGITVLEFTLTNPTAVEAIARVRAALPEFEGGQAAIGAGTVTTVAEAQQVLAAGAQLLVSPALNLDVLQTGKVAGVTVIPGAYTPTEILTAWQHEADLVKVFPARSLGPAFIRDVLSPLPQLRLLPTGGVDLQNLNDYLQAGAVAVGIGGNLVDAARIAARDWAAICATARRYVEQAQRS